MKILYLKSLLTKVVTENHASQQLPDTAGWISNLGTTPKEHAMKALIDGKIYDTEKADLICTIDEGREAIYLTKNNRWFSHIDGEYESINPLPLEHALEKMSAYYDDESVKAAIHKHFADDIEEA